MTKIIPLEDRILILPKKAEDKTAGGLIIPENAKEKPQRGNIKAIGDGIDLEKTTIKVDDEVLYRKNSGTELLVDDILYLIMRKSDILTIIVEED